MVVPVPSVHLHSELILILILIFSQASNNVLGYFLLLLAALVSYSSQPAQPWSRGGDGRVEVGGQNTLQGTPVSKLSHLNRIFVWLVFGDGVLGTQSWPSRDNSTVPISRELRSQVWATIPSYSMHFLDLISSTYNGYIRRQPPISIFN